MAKSKYEYVREFETREKCLPNCWIVVRVDGRSFSKFAEKHNFKKPNDMRSLNLMSETAKQVMKEFSDVILSYGQSDEYSFVLKKTSNLFNRRTHKLVSVLCSAFTAYYITFWPKYFGTKTLLTPPVFDARVITYPTDENLKDYLAWRQADAHINNLYNTCFWNLVLKKKLSRQEAEERLKGTLSSDKNELLFSEFGINYNSEPEECKKGSVIIRGSKKKLEVLNVDIIGDVFWDEHNPFQVVMPQLHCIEMHWGQTKTFNIKEKLHFIRAAKHQNPVIGFIYKYGKETMIPPSIMIESYSES